MTLAHFLHVTSMVVYVATNVAVTFYAFPAYKRHRRLAFLLLVISGTLGIFITVWDWTIGRTPMPQGDYYWLWCARQFLFIIDALAYAVGVLLLLRILDPPAPTVTLRDYAARQDQSRNA